MAADERGADRRRLATLIRGEIEDVLVAALDQGPFAQRWGPGVRAVASGFARAYLESLADALESGDLARFVRDARQAMFNAAGNELPGSEIMYVTNIQLRRHLGPTDRAAIQPALAAVEADIT